MIEWKVARNGDSIPFLEGKALASSVDPRREAAAWVKRLKDSLYENTSTIVVLGVGGIQYRFWDSKHQRPGSAAKESIGDNDQRNKGFGEVSFRPTGSATCHCIGIFKGIFNQTSGRRK